VGGAGDRGRCAACTLRCADDRPGYGSSKARAHTRIPADRQRVCNPRVDKVPDTGLAWRDLDNRVTCHLRERTRKPRLSVGSLLSHISKYPQNQELRAPARCPGFPVARADLIAKDAGFSWHFSDRSRFIVPYPTLHVRIPWTRACTHVMSDSEPSRIFRLCDATQVRFAVLRQPTNRSRYGIVARDIR
jgi:hypothetical protein